jgi:hypothetical protein
MLQARHRFASADDVRLIRITWGATSLRSNDLKKRWNGPIFGQTFRKKKDPNRISVSKGFPSLPERGTPWNQKSDLGFSLPGKFDRPFTSFY